MFTLSPYLLPRYRPSRSLGPSLPHPASPPPQQHNPHANANATQDEQNVPTRRRLHRPPPRRARQAWHIALPSRSHSPALRSPTPSLRRPYDTRSRRCCPARHRRGRTRPPTPTSEGDPRLCCPVPPCRVSALQPLSCCPIARRSRRRRLHNTDGPYRRSGLIAPLSPTSAPHAAEDEDPPPLSPPWMRSAPFCDTNAIPDATRTLRKPNRMRRGAPAQDSTSRDDAYAYATRSRVFPLPIRYSTARQPLKDEPPAPLLAPDPINDVLSPPTMKLPLPPSPKPSPAPLMRMLNCSRTWA